MASVIRQTALLPAGCQPWNANMVASCGSNFAYCATLAVYIYEYIEKYGEYKLSSIHAGHNKTITCIAWNTYNSDLFATAGADQKIFVWDVVLKKSIAMQEKLNFTPVCIGWIPGKNQSDVLAFCGKRGPVQVWNTKDDTTSPVDFTNSFDFDITVFCWHHTDPSKFIFGHTDGSLSLHISGKRTKHTLRTVDENTPKEDNEVVAALWDPLSSDYLLISRKYSGIHLIDVKTPAIITHFTMPSKMVSTLTLSWIDSAPGMFLTGDHQSGVLRLWSVSQSLPLESISVKGTGFQCIRVLDSIKTSDYNSPGKLKSNAASSSNGRRRSSLALQSHCIPPAKVMCAFSDGGIGLYNLQERRWEFLREQGHIETVFDCKFKPSDPKVLATASFDGTARIWSAVDLTPMHSTTGNEGVIYSLAWAPGESNYIVCGTRRRGVFVWDIDKCKVIRRFKEHGMHAVYCVAWNARDVNKIASCSDDNYCVVRKLDGTCVKRFNHHAPAFGCEWNPFDKDSLATGCDDGIVRVWSMTSDEARTLRGHTSKVFNVRWHPLLKGVLCSGSDDCTVRVWESESGNCRIELKGHSMPVRGLCWNFEVPFLLSSGSWDSTLMLWDVRSGNCIEVVKDHGADIYGLTSHCQNPFTMASSSRDSTLRLWSLSPLVQMLYMEIMAGGSPESVIAAPEACMEHGATLRLSGRMSKEVVEQLQGRKHQEHARLRWFSELFCSSRRLENLWDLVCVVGGQRESSLSKFYRQGILHRKHLIKYKEAEAQECEHSMACKSGPGRTREESLSKVAHLYMRLGNIRRHCEALIQLGQWERALSLAPSVSKSYWSSIAARYVDILQSEGDTSAVDFLVATGKISDAVQVMTSRHEFQDALLLATSSEEGYSPKQIAEISEDDDVKNDVHDDCVTSCYTELALRYYGNADPYSAASVYLAHDDVNSAVDCLVKGNKLPLALSIASSLKGDFPGAVVGASLLASRCERDGRYDTALKLVRLFGRSDTTEWSSSHAVCARFDCADSEMKARLHEHAGFPSPSECSKLATDLINANSPIKAMRYFVLGDSPQQGLELGVNLLLERLHNDDNWTVDNVIRDMEAVFCVRSDVMKSRVNKELRAKLLAVAAYFGALLAYRRQYNVMVQPMFRYAMSMCELGRRFDANFPIDPQHVEEEMESIYQATVDGMDNNPLMRLEKRAGREKDKCLMGETVANASDLPSHSDYHVSTITGRTIKGPPYYLEDGRSVMSLNEALMWTKCNPFSYTGSGERLCPF